MSTFLSLSVAKSQSLSSYDALVPFASLFLFFHFFTHVLYTLLQPRQMISCISFQPCVSRLPRASKLNVCIFLGWVCSSAWHFPTFCVCHSHLSSHFIMHRVHLARYAAHLAYIYFFTLTCFSFFLIESSAHTNCLLCHSFVTQ